MITTTHTFIDASAPTGSSSEAIISDLVQDGGLIGVLGAGLYVAARVVAALFHKMLEGQDDAMARLERSLTEEKTRGARWVERNEELQDELRVVRAERDSYKFQLDRLRDQ